jgi:peptide/nickel transport system ATP-binding protein
MARPVLSVDTLSIAFRLGAEWRPAVTDLSFAINAGETLALVGESGSGKTVTALSIARLLPSRKARITGGITVSDKDVLALSEREMARVRGREIGFIFQEPMTSLNPVMTVGAQLGEVLRRHRGLDGPATMAEAVRLLERVRIPAPRDRIHNYPHNLSGGMRQRIMIAMALAGNPRLLIADEPTTALDVTVQAEILNLIKLLQDEDGMAVLFITHDMGVVAEISDKTIVMFRGAGVETGPTPAIFAAPREPYTKLLLSAAPKLGAGAGADGPQRYPTLEEPSGAMMAMPARQPGKPVLEVAGLTTRFALRATLLDPPRHVHAVENISFSLRSGETLSLVGESGCGKSTTGRSLLQLLRPSAGSIRFEGQEIGRLARGDLRRFRRRIQMIFQDPFASLDPRMTVGKAIAEPMIAHGIAKPAEARDRVAVLLQRVGLSAEMAGRHPHEFSGGQRQRICIARALALEPQVIVADECVSALDTATKAQVINLMLDLQQATGIAYIFISHDMAVVERVSHRVAVMYRGEIVEIGPRAQIFANAQHAYTRKLLAAVPAADPANRHRRRPPSNEEIQTPIYAQDYVPPQRRFRSVGPDHLVQE